MNCNEVTIRLVAWQDEELSPGERIQVTEHLAACADCRQHEAQLTLVTPEPPHLSSDAELAEKWHRLDLAIEAELDAPRPIVLQRPWTARALDWLAEEVQVPTGAALAYAAALMLVALWGASNWKAAHDLQVAVQQGTTPATVIAGDVAPGEIRVEDYRPAAFVRDSAVPPLTEDTDNR